MDCSPPGSSVHGILQARILDWVAISFSNTLYIILQLAFFGSHCKWYSSILFQAALRSIHSVVWLHCNLTFSHGDGYLGSCPCFCYHKLCCNNHSSTVSRTQVQERSGTIPHWGTCRLTGYERFTVTTFPQLSCQMWPQCAPPPSALTLTAWGPFARLSNMCQLSCVLNCVSLELCIISCLVVI